MSPHTTNIARRGEVTRLRLEIRRKGGLMREPELGKGTRGEKGSGLRYPTIYAQNHGAIKCAPIIIKGVAWRLDGEVDEMTSLAQAFILVVLSPSGTQVEDTAV